ncbi:tetratricopeptide repeat protein [Methylocapsa sp. S129]|uniref:tetratricopeptide repeat protein n=1 Tax=Methylocapsa sp. S129 TaxID=1641869 RepID=UPI00131B4031|nr:tetratricopeptide repeat protein [Methylocapsa sp. S129]
MSDIFREVDEDVRRDKAAEFWKKNQNYIIAVAALIVLATAGWRFYDYRRLQAAQAAGAQFEQALELDRTGKTTEAASALAKIAAEGPQGYRLIARLSEAALQAKTDPAGAITAYDALAQDAAIGSLFQETARLRAALLRLDAGQTDQAKAALEPLAAPTGAYRHTAREMLAMVALQAQDYEGAGKWLDMVVADPDAPRNVRQNAELLLGLVSSAKPAPK